MKRWIAVLLAALLLLCAGCTPKMAETPPPMPTVAIPDDPVVKTDWSKLAPYEPDEGVYTRRYAGFTDTLLPASDYGPLVPYLGGKIGGLNGDGNRYGLVTLKGEIVTDPVFANVWQGGYSFGYHDNAPLPYYMLSMGAVSATMGEWPDVNVWAMCATDGSWVTEFKYAMDGELVTWGRDISSNCTEDGLFVVDGTVLVYVDGATGTERLRIEDISEDNLWEAMWTSFWREDTAYFSYDYSNGYIAINAATGERTELSREKAEAIRDAGRQELNPDRFNWGDVLFTQEENGLTVTTADGTVLEVDQHSSWYRLRGYNAATHKKYAALPSGGNVNFYDETGSHFATLPASWDPTPIGDLFYVVTGTYSGLRTLNGDWTFRYPLPTGEWD